MIRRMGKLLLILLAVGLLAAGAMHFVGTGSPPEAAKPHEDKEAHGSEGVALSDAKIEASGIELLSAGPAVLRDTLQLNGIVQPNQEALVQVTPRFPGVVREIRKRIGDRVESGEIIAKVESNQSLTVYELRAPIAGTIIDRQVSLGEYASEQKPAFTIADLGTVWIDFSVYRRDMTRVLPGAGVIIEPEDGGPKVETKVSYVSPVGNSDTQSALARAVAANTEGRLKPGFFVTGRLVLEAKQVPLAVKATALQTVENRTVVFVRNGQKFEPREVDVGERDGENVEIRFGLMEGDIYAGKNSFVVKAELAKGSASHEH